jgi:hypothetical protein
LVIGIAHGRQLDAETLDCLALDDPISGVSPELMSGNAVEPRRGLCIGPSSKPSAVLERLRKCLSGQIARDFDIECPPQEERQQFLRLGPLATSSFRCHKAPML